MKDVNIYMKHANTVVPLFIYFGHELVALCVGLVCPLPNTHRLIVVFSQAFVECSCDLQEDEKAYAIILVFACFTFFGISVLEKP